jgi:alpha-L-fucosidase
MPPTRTYWSLRYLGLSAAAGTAALAAIAGCSGGPPTNGASTTHLAGDARPADATAAQATQDSRMAWWRQARFGMFVHWGLYAIPAGAWDGKTDYGEWIRDSARIPRETYGKFQPQWNPTGFDADAWARLCKQAGMKYLVITSKHHDGFCLYPSRFTDWDVGNTPHGRDILRELADACQRHGIRFCTYHSIMDWHHPDYLPRRPWETDRSSDGADFRRFESYLHAQVTEIVERYQPAVMWFDGEWEPTWNHARGLKLWSLCRALAPTMLVNNRVDVHRGGMAGFSQSSDAVGDFATPEQEIPTTGLPGVDFESCMTMNRHWGWNAADTQWKSATELVRNLIDLASKGGNYLLNVGPRADGTFPPQAVERLATIGAWLERNGEAIYGTTASVFTKTPWGRCTVRAGDARSTLYLHVFDHQPGMTLSLVGLQNRVLGTRILHGRGSVHPGRTNFGFANDYSLHLEQPDPIATVVAVEIEGRPDVVQAPTVTTETDQFVDDIEVTIHQPSPSVVTTYTLDGSLPTAASARVAGPIRVASTCVLHTASFRGTAQATAVVAHALTKVVPLPPVKVRATAAGLRRELLAADWQRIPDALDDLVATTTDTATTVALPTDVGERTAIVFHGVVDVPADAVYRFVLRSDDGSKLWLDGQLVVDNDGLHGSREARGSIALGQGQHSIRLVWFNATGGSDLGLTWAAPGQPFTPLPVAALRH